MGKTNCGYIGFDPGCPATMGLINPNGKWVAYIGDEKVAARKNNQWTNVPEAFVHFLKKWDTQTKYPLKMVIENVGPMPGEGIVSASKFVGSIWMARTACIALGIPYKMVTPTTWKRDLKIPVGSDKEASRVMAQQLFPDRIERLKYKKDHNYAEAALLGYYGWRNEL